MSEMPALPPMAPAREVTPLARPLGLLVPVTFDGGLWAFCESGAADAGVTLDAERVARYLLTGLVRALRRAGSPCGWGPGAAGEGAPPPAVLPYRMALGQLEIALAARIEAGRIHVSDVGAIVFPPRAAG